ncbi:hypothetical protein [Tessaracoccus coleopterorum]|uniref:hypothetical protein n=1 Tax=Tessaracoccus coleopterorum TaxID=2714950 RepID=UPI001E3AAF54|nr:hypothetical protein [Tessaracoccus coleopterorum]
MVLRAPGLGCRASEKWASGRFWSVCLEKVPTDLPVLLPGLLEKWASSRFWSVCLEKVPTDLPVLLPGLLEKWASGRFWSVLLEIVATARLLRGDRMG